MLKMIRKVLRHPYSREYKKYKEARASLSWCPECGRGCRPYCLACKGETSLEIRNSNIDNFMRRRKFADHEILVLNGHLKYASPATRELFAETLPGILAAQFQAANKGRWTGDVALGLTAGHLVSGIMEG